MVPRSTPDSRIQTSSVDPDSASGSPEENPSSSTISTRGCRYTARLSRQVGEGAGAGGWGGGVGVPAPLLPSARRGGGGGGRRGGGRGGGGGGGCLRG